MTSPMNFEPDAEATFLQSETTRQLDGAKAAQAALKTAQLAAAAQAAADDAAQAAWLSRAGKK
jgi:hypothetical protein